MVYFASRTLPLVLVRERIPSAGEYRPALDGSDTEVADSLPTAGDVEPLDDADALDELGHEIATLAAHIHAATHRLLTLIRGFDRRRGWELDGQRSCAHWLALRTGIDLGAAREKVRVARALADLPGTSASMARGELSFSAVRALTRVAQPENEGDLLELARGCTTAQIEHMVRGWRRGSRKDEATLERELHETRTLSVFPDEEGMYVVRGRLDPEVGALLMRAIEAASDALFRERQGGGETPAAQGWAGEDETHRAAAQRRADAEPGRSELEDGTRVSAETSRRLSCDVALVRITHDGRGVRAPTGSVLDVGRRTRTIPPALRRALQVRDRGCRFPGCGSHFDGRWAPPRPGSEEALPGVLPSEDLVEVLVEKNRAQGVRPDGWTAGARWKREADIPDDVYFRALEAVG